MAALPGVSRAPWQTCACPPSSRSLLAQDHESSAQPANDLSTNLCSQTPGGASVKKLCKEVRLGLCGTAARADEEECLNNTCWGAESHLELKLLERIRTGKTSGGHQHSSLWRFQRRSTPQPKERGDPNLVRSLHLSTMLLVNVARSGRRALERQADGTSVAILPGVTTVKNLHQSARHFQLQSHQMPSPSGCKLAGKSPDAHVFMYSSSGFTG